MATLICYGGMLPIAMKAALCLLTENEIPIRILAPGRLYPLAGDLLGSLLVPGAPVATAEEGTLPYGVGAELCAVLTEFSGGKMGPFRRIGARNFPIAAARSLEDQILPQEDDIAASIRALVKLKS